MREFTTSAQQAEEHERVGEPITIKVDGREIVFNPPNTDHLVLMIAAIEASAQGVQLAASMMNSFFALIAEDRDRSHLKGRLFDPTDSFSMITVADILSGLIEEWSQSRPTQSSPGSSFSPPPGGSTSRGMHSGPARRHRGPSHSPGGSPSSTVGSVVASSREDRSSSTPSSES